METQKLPAHGQFALRESRRPARLIHLQHQIPSASLLDIVRAIADKRYRVPWGNQLPRPFNATFLF